MHKCVQLYVILEVCFFCGTLACHSPSFQVFTHISQGNRYSIFSLGQLAYSGTGPGHKTYLHLAGCPANE